MSQKYVITIADSVKKKTIILESYFKRIKKMIILHSIKTNLITPRSRSYIYYNFNNSLLDIICKECILAKTLKQKLFCRYSLHYGFLLEFGDLMI